MNRKEFMEQLRRLLYDIPPREREEALAYYEGYFDDAGMENEGAVIRELGSPGRVAAEIKAGFHSNPDGGEYTDTGYHNEEFEQKRGQNHDTHVKPYGRKQGSDKKDGIKILLLIALIVVTAPVWFSILGVLFSAFMGVLGIVLGLLAGTLFGGLGLLIVSIVMVVVGTIKLAGSMGLGLAVLGSGMIALAIGILLLIGFGWLLTKALPSMIRLVIDLFHRIFHRNRREEA